MPYQHFTSEERDALQVMKDKGSETWVIARILGKHLRQGHKKRSKRLSRKDRRGVIPNRRFIDERPVIVDRMARHRELAVAVGAKVIFAHPYHSWERGLNEHTNGLIRQYLSKTMRLDRVNSRRLASIVEKLNTRPRKSLGYRTPKEVFFKLLFALRA